MIITGKRIIKAPDKLKSNMQYYVAVRANKENMNKIGIKEFVSGITIQPSVEYGPTCKKNIYGYYEANKLLPKESRFIRTIYWEWTLFNGDTRSEYVDIYRECYQRIEYEPFCIEITAINTNGNDLFITKVDDFKNIKNVINIYLEVFGYCEIRDENMELNYENINFSRCNWIILPADEVIELRKKMTAKNESKKAQRKDYNQERLNELEKYRPIVRYAGQNGFQGYFAYIYDKLCVMENPIYGNATYIVDVANWEELSKMTKKSLINSGKLMYRIEHNKNWFNEIEKISSKINGVM